jgi:hypothetical protein
MLMRQIAKAQPVEFTFAGFAFPKRAWMLERGSIAKRKQYMRNPVTGPYSGSPTPNQSKGWAFYLASDFMPGLRYETVGGFSAFDGSESFDGLVMRLPHGRGFLAGWTMGEGMASSIDADIIEDEDEARRVARNMAEDALNEQIEFNASQEEEENEEII